MRFSVRGLDDVFTYPCTKADVREAFGDDHLKRVSFGSRPDHFFTRKETSGEITGRVLVGLSSSIDHLSDEYRQAFSLSVYRVRRLDWSDYLHWQAREIMKGKMRLWVEAMVARPEIAWGPYEEILLELREGVLHLHHRRAR